MLTPNKNIYLGLFFTCLATLMFELLMPRIWSVSMWYHFAFVAISMAMLGMTAGALTVYVFPQYLAKDNCLNTVTKAACAFCLSLVFSLLTQLCIPFFPDLSLTGLYSLLLILLLASLPFYFSGLIVTVILSKCDITNVAHYLRHNASIFIVGAGGGRDIDSALLFRQKAIMAVEINENVIDTITKRFADFSGHLDSYPQVKFVNDEARSYLARQKSRFDIIQMSIIDTCSATASGALALAENSLYTKDAWKMFLQKLNPNGVISCSRWYVVLFTLLTAGAAGSYLTSILPSKKLPASPLICLFLLIICLITFAILTPSVIEHYESDTTFIRCTVAFAMLAPIGFLMGTALPLGISFADKQKSDLIPWLWAVNGTASVVASVVAVAIAISFGFAQAYFTGLAFYLAAAIFMIRQYFRQAA